MKVARRAGLSAGHVVEIGSAAGFTLEAFKRAGWRVRGVEPNATMACYANGRLGVPTIHGPVERVDLPLDQDLVVVLQVLEHIRDPRGLLSRLQDSLRPGGMVLVETWSLHSWIAKAIGPQWHQYSPPTVLNWFSARSLTRLMNSVGLRLVRTGRPLKLITLQNGLSLVRAKYPTMDTPLLRRIADSSAGRLAVPYPPLDLFWALYRKPEGLS